jgi:hypothetical protein
LNVVPTNVPALLDEMRAQVCLVSMLDGPPYPNTEEKATLYKDVQLRARVRQNATGEFTDRMHCSVHLH